MYFLEHNISASYWGIRVTITDIQSKALLTNRFYLSLPKDGHFWDLKYFIKKEETKGSSSDNRLQVFSQYFRF